jgi:hypothetical protein
MNYEGFVLLIALSFTVKTIAKLKDNQMIRNDKKQV